MTATESGRSVIPVLPRDRVGFHISKPSNEIESTGLHPLSPRETQLLTLYAQGFTKPQIGGFLGISVETVKNHLSNVQSRMGGVDSLNSAIVVAAGAGILDPEALLGEISPYAPDQLDLEKSRRFQAIVEDGASKPYKQIGPDFGETEGEFRKRAGKLMDEMGVRNRTHALTLHLAHLRATQFDAVVFQVGTLPLVAYNALHLLAVNPSVSDREIADFLHTTVGTVRGSLAKSYRMLDVDDRFGAIDVIQRVRQRKQEREEFARKSVVPIQIYTSEPASDLTMV